MVHGQTTLVYTIGDVVSFAGFIAALRRIGADDDPLSGGDILRWHYDSNLSSTRQHPKLAKSKSACLHVHLQVSGEEETSSATLILRYENLYCMGFMNKNGVCYELDPGARMKLPSQYNSVPLHWGITYQKILNASDEEVVSTLDSARLGKTFAADAVRVLSRFPAQEMADSKDPCRLALAGLMVMVCESARMNPLFDAVARGWNTGTGFTNQLMRYMVWYEDLSLCLLMWRANGYRSWDVFMDEDVEEDTGVKSPIDALAVIHLVQTICTKY
ncbi:unnamed protein product [Urochloa decumbens]|uniref:rRNA N-glycosylase n=1 Tax=Urochloa decumbens TaxID=240449 RepID=A0ABC9H941_9POAL